MTNSKNQSARRLLSCGALPLFIYLQLQQLPHPSLARAFQHNKSYFVTPISPNKDVCYLRTIDFSVKGAQK
jgi:hypothetical protein